MSGWVEQDWRKSSSSDGDCVEVIRARALGAVRDSKNPTGPLLVFADAEFVSFLGHVKATS